MAAIRSPDRCVLLLLGPTAAGKTELALRLAEQGAPVDLISVDSAMVYRGLDIGTAKPSAAVRARIPHALIDIREPNDPYSVAAFLADAKTQVANSLAAGRTPLLVGGTMLYFKVLRTGLASLPPANATIRARIEALAAERGWPAVHAELAALDADSAASLSSLDSQRLVRALEVCQLTGEPFSVLKRKRRLPGLAEAFVEDSIRLHWWALNPPRAVLRERIAARFQAMLDAGLVEEVRRLAGKACIHPQLPSMRAVGYRQIYRCLTVDAGWEQMPQAAITATCQMAKRQQTWIRNWGDELALLPKDSKAACELLQHRLN